MKAVVFQPTLAKALLASAYTRAVRAPAVFKGGPLSFQEIRTEPLPTANHVRIRCRLAGICGSDLALLRFKFSARGATMARKRSLTRALCLGHEAVGEVIEIGSSVTFLRASDRVVLIPGYSCRAMEIAPPCEMCARGLPLLCWNRDRSAPRLSDGAAWSTEFVRHETQLLKIPASLTDDQAVLIEPLACAAHAVLRRLPAPGDDVIVIGCGAIGLGIIHILKALSIPLRIVAVARHPHQRALVDGAVDFDYDQIATALGATVLSRGNNKILHPGAARVYDAVGSSETIGHSLRWVRPRGAVIVEGINPAPSPRDCSTIWLREIDLLGAHGHGIESYEGRSLHTFQLVIDWLLQKKINPERLITHRFPLRDFREAIRVADAKASTGAIKVLLDPSDA